MKLTESYLKKIIKEEMVNEVSIKDLMSKLGGREALKSFTPGLTPGTMAGAHDYRLDVSTLKRKAYENVKLLKGKLHQIERDNYDIFHIPADKLNQISGITKDKLKKYSIKDEDGVQHMGVGLLYVLDPTQRKEDLKKSFSKSQLEILNTKLDRANKEFENIYKTEFYSDIPRPPSAIEPSANEAMAAYSTFLTTHRAEADLAVPKEKPEHVTMLHRGRSSERISENKKGVNNTMQLTTERLKQIIKEELEAIVNEMGEETETEEVSEVDAEIASLEQQLAEAKGKKAAMKSGKMAGTRKVKNPYAGAASHKMTPAKAPAKRHDKKGGY
jgi:hypothetical protein